MYLFYTVFCPISCELRRAYIFCLYFQLLARWVWSPTWSLCIQHPTECSEVVGSCPQLEVCWWCFSVWPTVGGFITWGEICLFLSNNHNAASKMTLCRCWSINTVLIWRESKQTTHFLFLILLSKSLIGEEKKLCCEFTEIHLWSGEVGC